MGDCFYIVEHGKLAAFKDVPKGAPQLQPPNAVYGPGSYFGELALLQSVPRAATVGGGAGPLDRCRQLHQRCSGVPPLLRPSFPCSHQVLTLGGSGWGWAEGPLTPRNPIALVAAPGVHSEAPACLPACTHAKPRPCTHAKRRPLPQHLGAPARTGGGALLPRLSLPVTTGVKRYSQDERIHI